MENSFLTELMHNGNLVTENTGIIFPETKSVWKSTHFPNLPLSGWSKKDKTAKTPFSISLINLDSIPSTESLAKTFYSVSGQGRAITFEPFVFSDDSNNRYLFLTANGVGKTSTDTANDHLYPESVLNRTFTAHLRPDQSVYSIRGATDIEARSQDKNIAEFLISRGFQTARPVMLLKREDQEAKRLQKLKGQEDFESAIYIRAFKTCFRMCHLEQDNGRQVLELEKKFLRLRGIDIKADEDLFSHFFNVFTQNLSILHREKVCYKNWNTSNVCTNGELVDFDAATVYGKDDKTIIHQVGDINHTEPKYDWEEHFSQLFGYINFLDRISALYLSEPTRKNAIRVLISSILTTSYSPNQKKGLDMLIHSVQTNLDLGEAGSIIKSLLSQS